MSSNSNKIDALNVDESKLDEYVIRVKDFCITNGLVLLSKPANKENNSSSIHDASFPLPVTLLPTLYPRTEFDFATALQPHFQQLVLSISNDYEFLKNSIKDVIKADDFTRRLWNICEIVKEEGISQPISLAILRNDYMLDLNKEGTNSPTILSQIELNTISCSFGAATTKISHLHKHSLRFTNNTNVLENHVKNENMSGLANGLVKAWRMYGNPKAKMVFLVSKNETNIGDQRLLEYKCIEVEPTLDVRRYTITDFANSGSLDEKKNLLIDGNEIGLVYFRSCYDPNDFIGDKEWDARLLIERSRAIKCPNIQVHLAGAKIVQQALTEPNALNKLVSNKDVIDRMKATFVDIYSIHDENISQIIDLINAKADEFVLKPQREGGGNNIYKDDIRKFVKTCEKSELKGYILMRLVRPPFGRNYIVRAGRPVKREELISEIGIFGYYIANGRDLVDNETTGYLLRTKSSGVNEGGVAAGFSALDSIVLV